MISMGLQACGMDTYDYDLYILVVQHVVCMIYFNNWLLFAKEDKYIYALVEKNRD